VLFTALVSNVPELTLAVLVMEPLAGDFTVNVRLLTCPAFSVPKAQLTTPPLLTPPPDALTNVTLAGNVSVTTTLLAADGPNPPLVSRLSQPANWYYCRGWSQVCSTRRWPRS
jgi:hypothetical protein